MLSSRIRSHPAVEQLARAGPGRSPRPRPAGRGSAARTASYAGTTPPAATTWLSLTIAMSDRLNRWLTPPPQRTAYFCRARKPGSVLRVSQDPGPGAVERVDPARGRGGDPGQVAGEVERGALGGQQPADRARDRASRTSPAATRVAVGSRPVTVDRRRPARSGTPARRPPSPATTPSSRAAEVGPTPCASAGIVATLVTSLAAGAGPRPARRTIAVVDRLRVEAGGVELGEQRGRQVVVRRQGGHGGSVRSTGRSVGAAGRTRAGRRRRARRRSARPSAASSRSGKSSRQCEPRVSSRSAGGVGQRGCDGEQVGGLPGRPWPTSRRRCAGQLVEPRRGLGQPGGRAQHADPLGHHLLERAGARPRRPARRSGCRRPAPTRAGSSAGRTLGDPAREHQALEQRVGGEPVGAVHAGAGDLAGGVQPRHAGPAPQVGARPRRRRSGRPARPGSAR